MKRFLTVTKLKPDMVNRYIQLHDTIGADVVRAAHAHHLRNYSIHMAGLYLFSYFEYTGTDYEADMRAKNQMPEIVAWRRETGPCFDQITETERMLVAREIFHHDF